MNTFLWYGQSTPKQTFADQVQAACDVLWEKHGVPATQIRVPLGYGSQVPSGAWTVEERRSLHDRDIMVGPLGE